MSFPGSRTPYELPRDRLPWALRRSRLHRISAEIGHILIHLDQVADISRDPAHSVKQQVNPGPPSLIAGVVAIQHEFRHFTTVQVEDANVGLHACRHATLRASASSRTWTCRS